jgi:hypothetical protein
MYIHKKWRAEQAADPGILAFKEWVRGAVQSHMEDASIGIDLDTLLLCTKSRQKAMWYTRIKAFRNHFWVEDDKSIQMQTYDSNVAFIFEVLTNDVWRVSLNYVGVLKDIFKLDYGPLKTPVILL